MEKKGEETGRRIRESRITETKERKKKKKDQGKAIDSPEKTENWLEKIFFSILYYRSERKLYSPTEKHPKVKLPRSRHK